MLGKRRRELRDEARMIGRTRKPSGGHRPANQRLPRDRGRPAHPHAAESGGRDAEVCLVEPCLVGRTCPGGGITHSGGGVRTRRLPAARGGRMGPGHCAGRGAGLVPGREAGRRKVCRRHLWASPGPPSPPISTIKPVAVVAAPKLVEGLPSSYMERSGGCPFGAAKCWAAGCMT
jgi:hypothetical protein